MMIMGLKAKSREKGVLASQAKQYTKQSAQARGQRSSHPRLRAKELANANKNSCKKCHKDKKEPIHPRPMHEAKDQPRTRHKISHERDKSCP